MGYLDFHMTFIIPPLAVLGGLLVLYDRSERRRILEAAGLLAGLATIWATPWDNYMVATGVWDYPADGVVGTIGYIPLEEQLFFILQPLMTVGLLGLLRDGRRSSPAPGTLPTHRRLGHGLAAGLLVVSALAAGLHLAGRAPYLTSIIAWFGPILALQVGVGFAWLWARRRLVTAAILTPTLYLCLADAIAIDQKYWTINPEATIGVEVVGLPFEEAAFFLVTNTVVVGGALLYLEWYEWLRGGRAP